MERPLPSIPCHPSITWLKKDRLKPSNLKASFLRLLEREREEWRPLIFFQNHSEDDLGISERLKALSRQWRTAGLLEWGTETRFCAAYLLDNILTKVKVTPRLLPAVADSTLLIAAKIIEEDQRICSLVDILHLGHLSLGLGELVRMERILLHRLQWNPKPCLSLEMLQTTHALSHVNSIATSCHLSGYHLITGCASLSDELSTLTILLRKVLQKQTSLRPSVLALALVSGADPHQCLPIWRGNEDHFEWLLSAIRISLNELIQVRTHIREVLQYSCQPSSTIEMNSLKDDDAERVNMNKLGAQIQQKNSEKATELPSTEASLCSPPPSSRHHLRPTKNTGRIADSKKRKRRHCGFRAKGNLRGLIRSSLKIPSKISVIAKGNTQVNYYTEEVTKVETEDEEYTKLVSSPLEMSNYGKVNSEVSLSDSPLNKDESKHKNSSVSQNDCCMRVKNIRFSPASPEFPSIFHLTESQSYQGDKKANSCKDEMKIPLGPCRPLTYAQVLKLHLAPLKQVLVS